MSGTTSTTPKPRKPRGLKNSGSKLSCEIADPKKYGLRPDELRILEDACRKADFIDQRQGRVRRLAVHGSSARRAR